MARKVPPPPKLSQDDQPLNRWLLELQSILNAQGTIDPAEVAGLPALFLQVAANTFSILLLQNLTTAQGVSIAALQADVATIQGQIAALQVTVAANTANIVTLLARNQVLNGNGVPAPALGADGDIYINNTGGIGSTLYVKITGAWNATAA